MRAHFVMLLLKGKKLSKFTLNLVALVAALACGSAVAGKPKDVAVDNSSATHCDKATSSKCPSTQTTAAPQPAPQPATAPAPAAEPSKPAPIKKGK